MADASDTAPNKRKADAQDRPPTTKRQPISHLNSIPIQSLGVIRPAVPALKQFTPISTPRMQMPMFQQGQSMHQPNAWSAHAQGMQVPTNLQGQSMFQPNIWGAPAQRGFPTTSVRPQLTGIVETEVRPLPATCTLKDIREMLASIGARDVVDVFRPQDRATGQPRHFCFVKSNLATHNKLLQIGSATLCGSKVYFSAGKGQGAPASSQGAQLGFDAHQRQPAGSSAATESGTFKNSQVQSAADLSNARGRGFVQGVAGQAARPQKVKDSKQQGIKGQVSVVIAGLPWSVTEAELSTFLTDLSVGHIHAIAVVGAQAPVKFKAGGLAYAVMSKEVACRLTSLTSVKYADRLLRFDLDPELRRYKDTARPATNLVASVSQHATVKTLRISRLPEAFDASELSAAFPTAVNTRIIRHPDGTCKGFAFVEFATSEDAEKFSKKDLLIQSKRVIVSFAKH